MDDGLTTVAWGGQLAALAVGFLFGAVVQSSHFCTMGCVSDAVLFGSFRRARVWALAIATALVGSQALAALGLVDLAATAYRASPLSWPGAVAGGLLFGFGMVLAGGCVSRNLARLGAGSLKALVTLLVTAVAASATASGVLAPLGAALRRAGTAATGGDQGLPALAAGASGVPPAAATLVITVAIAGALLVFALRDRQLRRSPADFGTGLALGALVPLAWLAGALAADPSAAAADRSAGLTFVAPVGDSLSWLLTAAGAPGFGVALVGGTLLGAAAVAGWRGEARLEACAGRPDLVRHLAGGALMGVGGALALGCSVGQGLTGVATLALGSWLALLAILAGGWWGVKHLETGRLLPFLPAAAARGAG